MPTMPSDQPFAPPTQTSAPSLKNNYGRHLPLVRYGRQMSVIMIGDFHAPSPVPIWHVSSRSGEASRELLYSVYFTFYFYPPPTDFLHILTKFCNKCKNNNSSVGNFGVLMCTNEVVVGPY